MSIHASHPYHFAPLDALYWQQFKLIYRAKASGAVPKIKGSAIRGILRHALKANTNSDLYHQLFECRLPASHPFSRRFQTAPNPYILDVPDRSRTLLEKGEVLIVYLTLIGKAGSQLQELIHRLADFRNYGLGKGRVPLALESIILMPERYSETERFHRPPQAQTLSIELKSPLHIKQQRNVIRPSDLAPLVKRISERIALLAHFHCMPPW